jgi:serine/threonine protein kinase
MDRYRLGQVIGSGGMADVYAADDATLRRPVAVKLFRRDTAGDAARHLARCQTEIRLLAGLNHPGLVAVYDAGTETDADGTARPYLVMELVNGQTLRQVLEPGPMPSESVAGIGAQAAAALHYVHGHGIVHRDIKPANLLLVTPDVDSTERTEPRVKVTDFGVARALDGPALTETGTTVGTANYLSPEQLTGEPIGTAADVYALGLVLLECLTGRVAFPGTGIEAAMPRLSRDPEIPSALGARWCTLLTAMTDRDPIRRPTAAAVASVLTAPPVPGSTAPLPPVVPLTARRKPVSRRLVGVAAAIAIALIAGVALADPDAAVVSGTPTPHPATTVTHPVAHPAPNPSTSSAPHVVSATVPRHRSPAGPAKPAAPAGPKPAGPPAPGPARPPGHGHGGGNG